ncbi:MAG: hypothetical protein QM758_10245 [Armatimonas sp.]
MEERLPLTVRILSAFFKTIQILFWTVVVLFILFVGTFGCAPGSTQQMLHNSIAAGKNNDLQSQIDVVKFFDSKADADPDGSFAISAAQWKNLYALKKLHENGFSLSHINSGGSSVWSYAILHRDYEMYAYAMQKTVPHSNLYIRKLLKGADMSPLERKKFLALTLPLQKGQN